MRPFTSVISLEEARRRLDAAVRPIERTERVALEEASGRVASADIVSAMAVPPFARSAMDGYAVMAADLAAAGSDTPARLRILEQIFTGQAPQHPLEPGACAEIATGAPLPDGADAVVMVEDTQPAGEKQVAILKPASPGQNVGRKGGDISPGDSVVRRGDILTPSRIGAIAAVGGRHVDVYARPRVAVLSTGNEVIQPGTPLGAAQVYDVNRFTLGAVIASHGGVCDALASADDSLDALERALDQCRDADLIVFSGGSSVGNRDLVVDLVAARGTMIFHGIAVRPGKPTAFAQLDGKPFFGMPGNPTSCLSNAYIILVPFLRRMARLPIFTPRTIHAPLGRRIVSPAGRHQFYAVQVRDGVAFPAFKGSGEITSLSQADGYIEIPVEESTVDQGAMVTVTLF